MLMMMKVIAVNSQHCLLSICTVFVQNLRQACLSKYISIDLFIMIYNDDLNVNVLAAGFYCPQTAQIGAFK